MIIVEKNEGFEFEKFNSLTPEKIKQLFIENSLHRFNSVIYLQYYDTIKRNLMNITV
jgi:hypothetical protein